MIKNEQFWQHWREGKFDEALQCALDNKPKRRGAALRRVASEETAIGAISAGEFLYNYCMINPTVVKGLDFARAEDLSSLFQLSQFASTIDTANATGDLAQLQGYVAEQMMAQELTMAGYDIEFPTASNQAGWDLLIDGEPFQVKCGANKQIVETHFENYPDIPVYVNAELGTYYAEHPMVFTTSVTREQVLTETKTTLAHAEDVLDFEIPWIAAGVSAYTNVKRMRSEQLLVSTAIRNVALDTASRTVLATAGQAVLGTVGAVVLPGAGAIVFPMVGAYVGMAQGGKVSGFVKKVLAKQQAAQLSAALHRLVAKMRDVLQEKHQIKCKKWTELAHYMATQVAEPLAKQQHERLQLLDNMQRELVALSKIIDAKPLEAFERLVNLLGKSGIHMYSLRVALKDVEDALLAYSRKV